MVTDGTTEGIGVTPPCLGEVTIFHYNLTIFHYNHTIFTKFQRLYNLVLDFWELRALGLYRLKLSNQYLNTVRSVVLPSFEREI